MHCKLLALPECEDITLLMGILPLSLTNDLVILEGLEVEVISDYPLVKETEKDADIDTKNRGNPSIKGGW